MYIYTSAYSQSLSILLSRCILVDAGLMQYKLHNCEQDFYIILVIYKLKKIIAITLLKYLGYQAKPPPLWQISELKKKNAKNTQKVQLFQSW